MANDKTLNQNATAPTADSAANLASVALSVPDPGQTESVAMAAGQIVRVPFDVANQTVVVVGDDLRIEFENGAVLVLEDFALLAEQGQAPLLQLVDGSVVSGDALLAALTQTPVEAAAGQEAASGGGSEYVDDMGDTLGGIDKLGVQDPDPFGAAAAQALEDEQTPLPQETLPPDEPPENSPPVVEDSSLRVSEEGLISGLPDTTGDQDTTNLSVRSGQISFTDADAGDTHTITLNAPTDSLLSGGVPIQWVGDGTGTLIGYAGVGGPEIIRIVIQNDGNYTTTLSGPFDHADDTLEDDLSFNVTVNVSDGTVSVPATLTVTIEDDMPIDISQDAVLGNEPHNSITANLVSYGADGPAVNGAAVIVSTFDGTSDHAMAEGLFVYGNTGGILTANGIDLVYKLDGGDWIAVMDPAAATIDVEKPNGGTETVPNPDYDAEHIAFRLSVDDDAGTYTMAIVDGLDGAAGTTVISLADGKYHGGNDQVFEITADNGLVITATAYQYDEDGNLDPTATVNHNAFALGVSQGDKIEGDGNPSGGQVDDFLKLEFSQELSAIDLKLWHFDDGDIGTWVAYKNGVEVATQDFSYSDLTPVGAQFATYSLDAGTTFDTLVFSGNTGVSGYGLSTITLSSEVAGEDHSLTYNYTATDLDGDAIAGSFDVTFDGLGDIEGSAGADAIIGTPQADFIFGNEGGDRLIGGLGDDVLEGGPGSDIFVFSANAGEGHNTIHDFNIVEDRLCFSDLLDGGDSLDPFESLAFTDSVTVTVSGSDLVLNIPDQNSVNVPTTVILVGVADDYASFTGGTLTDLINTVESINVDTYAT